MTHNFFISHYNGDTAIANIFATSLRRVSLAQINPWFSSDMERGLQPGDLWFSQILQKLKESKAVVALLTPNSINKPWVYFECGVAQAIEECEVIPLCIGVKRDNVSAPLGLYQCYQLNDYSSAVQSFLKLTGLFEIPFDEEMAKPVIKDMISKISKITFETEEEEEAAPGLTKAIDELKNHVDKRFIELMERPIYHSEEDLLSGNEIKSEVHKSQKGARADDATKYSVTFTVNFPDFENVFYLDIGENETIQDILDKLYLMLIDFVEAYRYMEKWIIVNEETRKKLIVREIAYMIPAKTIFRPNTRWVIQKLTRPYVATDSKYPYR